MIVDVLVLSALAPIVLFVSLTLSLKFLSLNNILTENRVTGISAGLLVGLTFLDFIPHSVAQSSPFNFSITLLITLMGLLLIEVKLIPRLDFLHHWIPELKNKKMECRHAHQHHYHLSHISSFSAIGCMLICVFFDGIRLASAVMLNVHTTIISAIALLAHILPEGIIVMGLAKNSGLSKRNCLLLKGVFCLVLGLGMVITGFAQIYIAKVNILALSSATLLYVCFIHLLPSALQKKSERWFFCSLLLVVFLHLMGWDSH